MTEHLRQAPAIQGVASHLEHQLAGARVAHDLKHRETEAELVARGILLAGEG